MLVTVPFAVGELAASIGGIQSIARRGPVLIKRNKENKAWNGAQGEGEGINAAGRFFFFFFFAEDGILLVWQR